MENNISSENNYNNCSSKEVDTDKNNKSKEKYEESFNENNTKDIKPNKLLYDQIISDRSNKNIIVDNNEHKENKKSKESFYISKFSIDITNEELNLLNEEKNKFPSFLNEFNDIFYKNKNNKKDIINKYSTKIQEIENIKGNIPNYYYFFLLLKKKTY